MRGALLLLVPFALPACGGELSAAVDAASPAATPDAATDEGAPDDVVAFPDASRTVDAASEPCPLAPPIAGQRCNTRFVCEYGTEPSPTCNQLFECFGATWLAVGPTATCPIPPPTGCPPTFAEASPDAGLCTSGVSCDYAAGMCQCSGHGWYCLDAPASCPKQRPRLGTPCSIQMAPTEWCPFEFDGFGVYRYCFAHGYRCSDGVWGVSESCAHPP